MGPPFSEPSLLHPAAGDPAGAVEPCRWSVDYSLWIIVRGALRSPQGPCAARALSPDRFLGLSDVRWASCAGEGACAGESLDRCKDPRQLGQSPEGAEGQPGPASGMSFFTLKNFFLLSPLFFKSVYIFVDLQSVYISVFFTSAYQKSCPTLTVLVNDCSFTESRCHAWIFSVFLGLVDGFT